MPTWSDGDVPPIPSMEKRAIKELQEECRQMLAVFPTNSKEDQEILGKLATHILIHWESCFLGIGNLCLPRLTSTDSMPDASRTLEAAIKYVTVSSQSFVDLNC